MKLIFKTILLVITMLLTFSCDQNDDVSTPVNKFTSAGLDFETSNCYIEYDDDDQNQFNLFFLDGRMFDNDARVNGSSGEYLFSTNTSNFVFFNVTEADNPSITMPQYPNIVLGTPYIGSDGDSVIMHGFTINSLTPNFNYNGFEFGDPNPTGGGVAHQPMPGNTATITINNFNFNTSTQTGTIDVDYQFLDSLGNSIIGHYEGALGLIFD